MLVIDVSDLYCILLGTQTQTEPTLTITAQQFKYLCNLFPCSLATAAILSH